MCSPISRDRSSGSMPRSSSSRFASSALAGGDGGGAVVDVGSGADVVLISPAVDDGAAGGRLAGDGGGDSGSELQPAPATRRPASALRNVRLHHGIAAVFHGAARGASAGGSARPDG